MLRTDDLNTHSGFATDNQTPTRPFNNFRFTYSNNTSIIEVLSNSVFTNKPQIMVAKIEHKNRSGCPIACSLDFFGDHWTLLIIRNLMFVGRHEYKDMLKAEEQISSSILSARLTKLSSDGIIASIPHPNSQRRKLYYLTPMGKDLVYVMVELIRWANTHTGDFLDIPNAKKELLEKNPKMLVKMTIEQLDAWEKEFL